MAIVIRDGERLYFNSWNYNGALIISELAKIVENHGGRVKPCKTAVISNRSLAENINKYQERKQLLQKAIDDGRGNEKTVYALKETARKLEEIAQIDNNPVTVTHTSYISFVLDNQVYYYQIDDNPFFPFYYTKTPLRDGGKYSRDAALTEDNKEWCFDCFLYAGCARGDIVEAANVIFNTLVNAKPTQIIRDSKRQRVPNRYDGGYHYETIYSPERVATLDF